VAARRRPPEAARREILEAAMRVFRHHHPDEVGLKEVAREAGVSHALITHYFGSFGGLCDAALELRVVALRELMIARMSLAGGLDRPGDLLATLFEALEDPVHKRLWMWALATERTAANDFFPLRNQGLRLVAERVASSIAATTGAEDSAILPEVERTLLVGVAAAYGYTIGRQALVGALGKPVSRELDRAVQDSLGEMMREHLLRHAEAQATQEKADAKGRRSTRKRRAAK
jgi:AcrR family transcriptional regulator